MVFGKRRLQEGDPFSTFTEWESESDEEAYRDLANDGTSRSRLRILRRARQEAEAVFRAVRSFIGRAAPQPRKGSS